VPRFQCEARRGADSRLSLHWTRRGALHCRQRHQARGWGNTQQYYSVHLLQSRFSDLLRSSDPLTLTTDRLEAWCCGHTSPLPGCWLPSSTVVYAHVHHLDTPSPPIFSYSPCPRLPAVYLNHLLDPNLPFSSSSCRSLSSCFNNSLWAPDLTRPFYL
jgi:hypothetical protein